MYKYLPTENSVALKTSLNKIISENNISSSKISKAIGVDTSHLKVLRDPNNEKMEISPTQYMDLLKYLSHIKTKLDLGEEPEGFFDKFMFYLYKKGCTFDQFCFRAKTNRTKVKSMFTDNGVSSKYKDIFTIVLTEEEFNNLNSYNSIVLSSDRDEKIIRCINDSTLINIFMIKRGYTPKDLATKMGYREEQVKSILQGFILDSNINAISKALDMPKSAIDNVVLNSWDLENNFGYFIQKTILEKRHNVYSISEKMNINYCDLKGIVSGTRNIKEDEFDKISLALNIDPDDLRANAPNIVEGDDKYIPYNFVKWVTDNQEVTFKEMSKTLGKDAQNLYSRIKRDVGGYKLPDITKLMTLTGLTKEQLRATLTEKEIQNIKSSKRSNGRKITSDPDSFDVFIRDRIKEKGLIYTEFAKLLEIERNSLYHQLKVGRIREDILKNMLDVLDLTKADIKKFKVKTFKDSVNDKSKKNVYKITTPKQPKIETKEDKTNIEPINDPETIKFLARSIFRIITKAENEYKLDIDYNDESFSDLIDNDELRNKVIGYIKIILIDARMTDHNLVCQKLYNPGAKRSTLHFELIKPEPANIISSPTEIQLHKLEPTISSDDKEFMMEELDKFLDIYSKLSEPDQCTILRMMNLVKYPDDIKMENIPEEWFELGKYAEYKKIDALVKLIGLK